MCGKDYCGSNLSYLFIYYVFQISKNRKEKRIYSAFFIIIILFFPPMIQWAKPHRLGQAVNSTSQQAMHVAADILPFIKDMTPSKVR